MKKTLVIMLTMFSFLAFAQVAEAKRFGFGGSYGYSKKIAPKQYGNRPASPSYQQPKQSSPYGKRPTSGASKWLGPLAGFAAGGLLAALLFGDGFQGIQPFDILLFILAAFILISLFKRRQPVPYASREDGMSRQREQYAEEKYQQYFDPMPATPTQSSQGSIIGSAIGSDSQPVEAPPAWFDKEGFLANAKHHFVAVQKAWDAQDMSEIRAYCTPELIDALEREMQSVDMSDNHTQVDDLRAEIAELATEGDYFIVSVRFSGFIIEEQGGFAHAFNEIWHIQRLAEGEGDWKIAGIQQVS